MVPNSQFTKSTIPARVGTTMRAVLPQWILREIGVQRGARLRCARQWLSLCFCVAGLREHA